ncbi:MAG: hypothetical protein D6687_09680 [Acidobacteria bacterium]|jgi:ElaB/YqjD/DUF883 family membrane-anchored ribosome-binding protein|nr:MAG: hypothetical protein D6687_09680 [Acidobacteriota bacterium]GIU81294.1 MAG: hypothetical protein KatS3mg006_0358 [Pyrinomonadaceae bacterium]
MSEFNQIDEKKNQSLVPVNSSQEEFSSGYSAQDYQQKIQEVALKAKEFLNEKFAQASEKVREISSKDPQELIEDAKEFARKNPGQAILISAAVGLVLGILIRGRR